MKGMKDVIFFIVYSQVLNPIENVLFDGGALPCLFQDHPLRY